RGLPPLVDVDPPGVQQVRGEREVQAPFGGPRLPHHLGVPAQVGVALLRGDADASGDDQHGPPPASLGRDGRAEPAVRRCPPGRAERYTANPADGGRRRGARPGASAVRPGTVPGGGGRCRRPPGGHPSERSAPVNPYRSTPSGAAASRWKPAFSSTRTEAGLDGSTSAVTVRTPGAVRA